MLSAPEKSDSALSSACNLSDKWGYAQWRWEPRQGSQVSIQGNNTAFGARCGGFFFYFSATV